MKKKVQLLNCVCLNTSLHPLLLEWSNLQACERVDDLMEHGYGGWKESSKIPFAL